VVGHVEWVTFARVDHLPRDGEIVHATETWEIAGGGGAVAARVLVELNGSTSFFTAFGDDELGHRAHEALVEAGVNVHATFRPTPMRRAFTHLDGTGERTITVLGDRLGPQATDPLPWDELGAADAVYFTAGDASAVTAARFARVLVATSRDLPPLAEARVLLDALVGSAEDPAESYRTGDLDPAPELVVRTEGERGGVFQRRGQGERRYAPVAPRAAIQNRYGAGDSFAAGLTFALAQGKQMEKALAFAARCGADALSVH
jgi:ribokinase